VFTKKFAYARIVRKLRSKLGRSCFWRTIFKLGIQSEFDFLATIEVNK